MEITIDIWKILGLFLGLFIGSLIVFKGFRERVAEFIGFILAMSTLLILVGIIPACIYYAVADTHSRESIHKYAPKSYHNHITFWEKISLKKVPLSELKERHDKLINEEEVEKKKYLGS